MSLNLIIIMLTVLVSIYVQNNTNLYAQFIMNSHEIMRKRHIETDYFGFRPRRLFTFGV